MCESDRTSDDTAGRGRRRSAAARALSLPFVGMVRLYQVTLGPLLGGRCRFYPTCSQYALDAFTEHNVVFASWLTIRRLLRCHPLCKGGVDTVPLRRVR